MQLKVWVHFYIKTSMVRGLRCTRGAACALVTGKDGNIIGQTIEPLYHFPQPLNYRRAAMHSIILGLAFAQLVLQNLDVSLSADKPMVSLVSGSKFGVVLLSYPPQVQPAGVRSWLMKDLDSFMNANLYEQTKLMIARFRSKGKLEITHVSDDALRVANNWCIEYIESSMSDQQLGAMPDLRRFYWRQR